jgi:hypothetical protein
MARRRTTANVSIGIAARAARAQAAYQREKQPSASWQKHRKIIIELAGRRAAASLPRAAAGAAHVMSIGASCAVAKAALSTNAHIAANQQQQRWQTAASKAA